MQQASVIKITYLEGAGEGTEGPLLSMPIETLLSILVLPSAADRQHPVVVDVHTDVILGHARNVGIHEILSRSLEKWVRKGSQ